MKHSLFTLGIVAASLSVATLSCTTQQQPTEVTWGTFNIRYDNPGDSLRRSEKLLKISKVSYAWKTYRKHFSRSLDFVEIIPRPRLEPL